MRAVPRRTVFGGGGGGGKCIRVREAYTFGGYIAVSGAQAIPHRRRTTLLMAFPSFHHAHQLMVNGTNHVELLSTIIYCLFICNQFSLRIACGGTSEHPVNESNFIQRNCESMPSQCVLSIISALLISLAVSIIVFPA